MVSQFVAPTVTIYLHGGPLNGQSRLVIPQARYMTQTIEHSDTEWWETIYVYWPNPVGGINFYLGEVIRLHCDDFRH